MEYFNAQEYAPTQGGTKHPVGKFPATITNTELKPFTDGMMLKVEFSTPAGKISKNYGIESNKPEPQRISREQLSALCHATGIFRLTMAQHAFELRNGQCYIEVVQQDEKFNQISTVYDIRGEIPKAGAVAPQQNAPIPQPPQFAQGQMAATSGYAQQIGQGLASQQQQPGGQYANAPTPSQFAQQPPQPMPGQPGPAFAPQPMAPPMPTAMPGQPLTPSFGQPAANPQQPTWATPQR